MNLVVETRDVHKTFQIGKRTLKILKGITLQVPKGEFLTIVGPSGSGKSTLLGLIGSLDTPTSGEIWIDGTDITTMTEDQLAEVRNKKVGFVFQFFNLINSLTALENVALPASLNTSSSTERAEQLLDLVGLRDRLDHRQVN
jgi:putative ABC transport system ATP-binding protein